MGLKITYTQDMIPNRCRFKTAFRPDRLCCPYTNRLLQNQSLCIRKTSPGTGTAPVHNHKTQNSSFLHRYKLLHLPIFFAANGTLFQQAGPPGNRHKSKRRLASVSFHHAERRSELLIIGQQVENFRTECL